ncbi:FAD-dependent oxidoreductase [Pseudovibrio sp. JE062]|uniref:FAD-dependent oxidoreductase n=1 Tax=Pseudovibrio sp. JE062 TaxID=439495 RepID=UPI000186C091|nr:FAD-dependent oxidoreductase [Pseudovibrio sp. JE062]EEA94645.1 FAD dependent oxidoreductase [Pseudovibrio sp. JE062]
MAWKELALSAVDSPVLDEADVVVCGGGPAGVAAAVMSARDGLKTILVEKNGFCGGAATAGLSGTICGLYLTQDEIAKKTPKQVVFGFAEEFRQRLEGKQGVTEPQIYGNTHVLTFDPLRWREVADDLLEEAGVTCLYHCLITEVMREDQRIKAIKLESSAGSTFLKAKAFIDATGDAAVLAKAGCEHSYGDKGNIQNPTMMFRLSNVEAEGFYKVFGEDTISPAEVTEKIREVNASGERHLPRDKVWVFPTPQDGVFLMNCTRLAGQGGRMLNVINPADRTYAEIYGRRSARDYHAFFKENVEGFEKTQLIDMPPEIGVRQTRTIRGTKTLTNDQVVNCEKPADGIARSSWPIELHAGKQSKLHWLMNDYYEIPWGTLVPEELDNTIVAGRCLSAEHEALASARVTAQCFEMGHAAAVATKISLESAVKYKDLDPEQIRQKMRVNNSAL